MEDNDNEHWIESRDSNYKIDHFYNLHKEFKKLDLPYMLIAIAPNGGPIAITSNKRELLTLSADDPSLENVCIYSNSGRLQKTIKIDNPFREVVVCFDFLQDESLLVLFEKGYYWVVDPFKGTYKKHNIALNLRPDELIHEGKVFENGFAFITTKHRFLFVRNSHEAICSQFRENELKNAPKHWIVLPPKQIISEKVEIHITHSQTGIIQIVEDEHRKVFYSRSKQEHMIESKIPEIKYATFISQFSNNGRFVCYLSAEPIFKEVAPAQAQATTKKKGEPAPAAERQITSWVYRLIFASTDFQGTFFKTVQLKRIDDKSLDTKKHHLDGEKRPKNIVWCQDDAVVIQYQNNQLYMVFMKSGDIVRIDNNRDPGEQYTHLKQQIDGIRFLTKQRNKILRKIPESYVNIFESLSQKAGALLYSAYIAFQQKEPLQDDEIRNKKGELAQAVKDCIEAAKFEERSEVSIQLMKAASYGKSFLQPNQIPNNIIQEVCRNLRVLNQLRSTARVITYTQFEKLTEDQLLKILLRYNMHYIAFEIYQYLKKSPKFRIQIYTHWACCKVESNEDEDTICRDIKNKLSNEKGVSFTEIAHRAIELGKSELALKLLQYEPALAKKVPLLLWMGSEERSQESGQRQNKFFAKALSDALLSKDPNLLCLVIQKIRMSGRLTEFEIFELFSKSFEARCALISYYRIFDYAALNRYYQHIKDKEMSGIFALYHSYRTSKYSEQLKLMEASLECFKQQGKQYNAWRVPSLQQYVKHYAAFVKEYPKVVYRTENNNTGTSMNMKPGNINGMMEGFMLKNNTEAADEVKGEYKISDKRVILSKIKTFINQGKYEDLDNFVDKYQKKYKLPVEMIADFLMKKKEDQWAMKMLAKMPEKEKDEQYALLQRIGKVKEAINLAADRRDIDTLQEIRASHFDPEIIAHLNQKMFALNKK